MINNKEIGNLDLGMDLSIQYLIKLHFFVVHVNVVRCQVLGPRQLRHPREVEAGTGRR